MIQKPKQHSMYVHPKQTNSMSYRFSFVPFLSHVFRTFSFPIFFVLSFVTNQLYKYTITTHPATSFEKKTSHSLRSKSYAVCLIQACTQHFLCIRSKNLNEDKACSTLTIISPLNSTPLTSKIRKAHPQSCRFRSLISSS